MTQMHPLGCRNLADASVSLSIYVPNALGALCLNQAGQDQLTARPDTIPRLFSIFTSEDHQRVL